MTVYKVLGLNPLNLQEAPTRILAHSKASCDYESYFLFTGDRKCHIQHLNLPVGLIVFVTRVSHRLDEYDNKHQLELLICLHEPHQEE